MPMCTDRIDVARYHQISAGDFAGVEEHHTQGNKAADVLINKRVEKLQNQEEKTCQTIVHTKKKHQARSHRTSIQAKYLC